MKIVKTLVGTDDGKIDSCDTIEHEGGLWLVPVWLEAPTQGWRKPGRIIRMDNLPHQNAPAGFQQQYVLNVPIPRAVLDGRTPPEQAHGFVVIDAPPNIEVPLGTRGIH